jgi:DNA-binding NarL/FixJ family response regulator
LATPTPTSTISGPTSGRSPERVLLVSANWPQRALIRAQLAADLEREVVGADSAASAVDWLRAVSFGLVILDTPGLRPDRQLVDELGVRRTPVLLVTGHVDRATWAAALAGLEVRAELVRPLFIGDLTRAARLALAPAGE